MNKTTLSLAGMLALVLTSCATSKTYTIESKSNSEVQCTAMFTQKGNTVELDMNVLKLNPNGVHAAHINENGDCSAPDGSSAGGHWNPTSLEHGKWGMVE